MGVNVKLDRAGILHDCVLNIFIGLDIGMTRIGQKNCVDWTKKQQKEPLNQCLRQSLECLHSAGVKG